MQVYSVSGTVSANGGTDNFDSVVARPDLWVADLASVISPIASTANAGQTSLL
jgi:hypothetical protein